MKNTRVMVNFTQEEMEEVIKAAIQDMRPVSSWCRMAVISTLRGTRLLNISTADNSEVILQKRDATGKFTKKGGHNDKR